MNYNIRSINKRFEEFSLILNSFEFEPAVIALTESQLRTNVPFHLSNYNSHNYLARHTTHDSITIFIHKNISQYEVRDLNFKSAKFADLMHLIAFNAAFIAFIAFNAAESNWNSLRTGIVKHSLYLCIVRLL